MNKYKVDVYETSKSNIPQRKSAKEQVMPKFPFSMMISGSSGSGKTNLLMNILNKKELYGKYFHYIIVFSPTAGKYDDIYKNLKIPDENFIRNLDKTQLEDIIECRKKLIDEKGIEWVAKNSRVLIIMDDVIADRGFLNSNEALILFSLLRHYLCSIIVMMQSYNKLPRPLRINCNAIMVFPCLQSECEILLDEITPSGIKKRDFEKVLEYATKDKYNFLYINRHADREKMIRKNLDEIIDLEKYKK
jgi:hypothetical protein